MMLSRLVLHPLNREVAHCVADAQRLHALVLSGFGSTPSAPRASHGVLHRLDLDTRTGALVLYVQSRETPNWRNLPDGVLAPLEGPNPAVRSLDEALEALRPGTTLTFRLRANVTRKIDTKITPEGAKRNGKRVPLRSDELRLAWLVRKAADAGFELATTDTGAPDVRITAERPVRGARKGCNLAFEGTRFDGRLRIVDVQRFRTAIATGIGPAKAYGFGLLSIAPG